MKNFLLLTTTLLIASGSLIAQEAVRFVRPVADTIPINGSFLFGETSSTDGTQLGVDFLTTESDTVYAAHPGTVGLVANTTVFGNHIILDGEWKNKKINTFYAHLTKSLVAEGATVAAGEAIAISGASGITSRAKLHFEVRSGWHAGETDTFGSRMNPEIWVAMENTGVIVGTVPNAENSTRVDINIDPKPRPPYETYSYSLTYDFSSLSLGNDPDYKENYAIGDVKPGTYTITADNGSYSETVVVKAGEITSVDGTVVTSNDEEIFTPTDIQLNQNYPNPFNPSTVINFSIPTNSFVKLAVYDMLGKQVALLQNSQMSAGTHDINFDASNLSSGVYLYRLQVGAEMLTRKLTLIK
tara:strand:+ start:161 stop:1228 length:1068 start_codon:yes stop_codon:yes gene_type:complete